MNLIYFCVFNGTKYLDLLKLLLISIKKYGNLKESKVKLIVNTSLEFKNIMSTWETELMEYFNDYLYYELTEDKKTVEDSVCARFDVFEFKMLNEINPEKIFYIDTDVLVLRSLDDLFSQITEDKIYAKREGSLWWNCEYWGRRFFGDQLAKIASEDASCFCAGILGFKNTETIKKLFNTVKNHISTNPEKILYTDQQYLVYHSKLNRLVENNKLDKYIEHNDANKDNKLVTLVHFCGNEGGAIGKCHNKYDMMLDFIRRRNAT